MSSSMNIFDEMSDIIVKVLQARDLPKADTVGSIDAYFIFKYGNDLKKTQIMKNNQNPTFGETFYFKFNPSFGDEILVELWDWDKMSSDDLVSTTKINISDYKDSKVQRWFSLTPNSSFKQGGEVELEVVFDPKLPLSNYSPTNYLPSQKQKEARQMPVQNSMTVFLRQKKVTSGFQDKKLYITNEYVKDIFYATFETFTLGNKLHVFDKNEKEVAFIDEKILTLWAQYDVVIHEPDTFSFVVKREYKVGFGHNFNLIGLNWTLKGDINHEEYCMVDDQDVEVFSMRKDRSVSGNFTIYIKNPATTLLQCVCIAFSMALFTGIKQQNK